MSWDVLSQLATNPVLDFFLKIATLSTGIVLVFTLVYNIKNYNKMRMMDQIKLAHDFFKDYRELIKQSAELYKEGVPLDQRKEWAEDYFNSLEWFAYIVNTKQIKNHRLISMFKDLILDSYKEILPKYFTAEDIKQDDFYPELYQLHDHLKTSKIKLYHPKRKNVNSKKHSE